MSDSASPQRNGYDAYAKICLDLAAQVPDRSARLMLREMAAAWLNVASKAEPSAGAGRRDEGPTLDRLG